jgi:hypothetical protein
MQLDANQYASYCPLPMKSQRKRAAPCDDVDDDFGYPARKIRHRRDGTNRRSSNAASQFYEAPLFKPVDWSPPEPFSARARPTQVFRYNEHGELLGNLLFSNDQLAAFLVGPRADGKAPSRREKLTVWIQQTPPYAAHRYSPDCGVCRWDKCPVKRNTISKGQFRVALDERASLSGKTTDPFRVAGYMHLFCFEDVFNIHCLFFDTDRMRVKPDQRHFGYEERNPMAIGPELVRTLEVWQRSEGRRLNQERMRGVRDPGTPSERKLWRALTRAMLSAPGYMDNIGKRNEIHLGTYEGDLRKYQRMVDERLQHKREARTYEIQGDVDEDPYGVPEVQMDEMPAFQGGLTPEDEVSQVSSTRYPFPGPSNRCYGHPASHERNQTSVATIHAGLREISNDIRAAVRDSMKGHDEHEVDRVNRAMQAWAPAVGELPHYKRLEVQRQLFGEAEKVRKGAQPRWASLPAGLGMRIKGPQR